MGRYGALVGQVLNRRARASGAAPSVETVNLGVAAVVLFLILAAMFRSLWDALLVLLSMPLAIAGGILDAKINYRYPLKDAVRAHEANESGTTLGATVLLR